MKWASIPALVASVVVLSCAACSSRTAGPAASPALTPSSTTTPSWRPAALTPISDSAPYWCGFVPKDALSKITGMGAGLTEASGGKGLCIVRDGSPAGPLGVGWDRSNGKRQLDIQVEKHKGYQQTALP